MVRSIPSGWLRKKVIYYTYAFGQPYRVFSGKPLYEKHLVIALRAWFLIELNLYTFRGDRLCHQNSSSLPGYRLKSLLVVLSCSSLNIGIHVLFSSIYVLHKMLVGRI